MYNRNPYFSLLSVCPFSMFGYSRYDISLYFCPQKRYYSVVLKKFSNSIVLLYVKLKLGRIKDEGMKKWISLILLSAVLATTIGGCKKGG